MADTAGGGFMTSVVIIDDDPQYAELLKRHVSAEDYSVVCCATLHDGQEAIASVGPAVVVLDVCLPDGNGLERIRSIKADPSLPEVIVVTATGEEAGAELAIRSGVWGYWQKGRPLAELMLSIAQAVAYRSDRISQRDWRSLDRQGVVGESPAMIACFESIAEASAGDMPVLICGETGTGKERVANAVHRNSGRVAGPFIVVDCASLTDSLVESTLFGHEKGAYTGANAERVGLVRQANGGTLFLDEIGELPLGVQKSFLRVLQEKRFRPVGADREVFSDFRLLAASNRNLQRMVDAGEFREDLFFRLRSMEIALPLLRDRGNDVVKIAEALVAITCERLTLPRKHLGPRFCQALLDYSWPGNVRELQQAVECAVSASGQAKSLEAVHLPIQIRIGLARASVRPELNPVALGTVPASRRTLAEARDDVSRAYLTQLLDEVRNDIEAACAIAGVSRSRFYGLLKEYGIGRNARPQAGHGPLSRFSCGVS
jgi:two-component system, NtrC family, response regulator